MSRPTDPSSSVAAPGPEGSSLAPHPGVASMPRWDSAELPDTPRFDRRLLAAFIGPALVMGASAVGGGEWLTGPRLTARYGAALFWLPTLSILFQTIYNIEISRYTLYSGEPIFTGKFRVPPGPWVWLFIYLLLDFGSLLPYLASNAAVPLFAMIFGRIPELNMSDVIVSADERMVTWLGVGVFLVVLIPLCVGGKIYNSMRAVMIFKLVVVFGFLLVLAAFFSSWDTWAEIGRGFVNFGALPVKTADGSPQVENVLVALWEGRSIPELDLTLLGFVAAMAAISGNGGLTNTPVSNYTRDQGWGMGGHVGAIPSIVGGHEISLSHVGAVFPVNEQSLPRWRRWVRHVAREQWLIWMPACFVGLALPSMLSVVFLPRGTEIKDNWLAASMTAGGVRDAVASRFGESWGPLFWHMTLFCGFLVLGTSMAMTADGVLRRWVDVFWTASPRLRKWKPQHIGRLYFGVLCVYAVVGVIALLTTSGGVLVILSTMMYNYALGFSCFHTLVVNGLLLPKALRARWPATLGLVLGGSFFLSIAVITTFLEWPKFSKALGELTGAPAATAKP